MTLPQLHPKFITDEGGVKTAVILPIEEYEELLEDIECLKIVRDRLEESTLPHNEVVASLGQ